MGQSNFEFVVDKEKCKRWGVQVADVDNVINTAVHGNPLTQMIEGEKTFDITLRWPFVMRQDEVSILEIPVDISNVNLSQGINSGTQQTPWTGAARPRRRAGLHRQPRDDAASTTRRSTISSPNSD